MGPTIEGYPENNLSQKHVTMAHDLFTFCPLLLPLDLPQDRSQLIRKYKKTVCL